MITVTKDDAKFLEEVSKSERGVSRSIFTFYMVSEHGYLWRTSGYRVHGVKLYKEIHPGAYMRNEANGRLYRVYDDMDDTIGSVEKLTKDMKNMMEKCFERMEDEENTKFIVNSGVIGTGYSGLHHMIAMFRKGLNEDGEKIIQFMGIDCPMLELNDDGVFQKVTNRESFIGMNARYALSTLFFLRPKTAYLDPDSESKAILFGDRERFAIVMPMSIGRL